MSEPLDAHTVSRNAALVGAADKHLDETFDRLEKGMLALWPAVEEQAKMLTTLSSGTLVLSVSIIQFITPRLQHVRWGSLVPLSWCLFALCVLVGAARQGWASQARAGRFRYETTRGEIRRQLFALPAQTDAGAEFDRILLTAISEADVEPARALQVVAKLNQWMFWLYAFGLCFLLAFAIRNLPF